MKRAVVEERFEYKGYPCVVIMQSLAFRTGYVGLKSSSKYFKKNYDDIPVNCHGCLTYAQNNLFGQDDKDTWWIGFDSAHYGDGKDYETALELFKDDKESIKQLFIMRNIENGLYENDFHAMSLDGAKRECMKIVDQLEESEGIYESI